MAASDSMPTPDVLAMRRDIYAKGTVTHEDLSRLLALGAAQGATAAPDFDELVGDVATDLLVHQANPTGYVSGEDTDWLMQAFEQSKPAASTQQRVLLEILRRSVSVPARLASFTVGALEDAIVDGPKVVTAADVEALRVAVFAATDASALHVTRESADALFRIARATRGAENDPAFADFFAKAVGDHLLGIAFHWVPSAAEEIQKEQWLEAEPPHLGSFFGRMFGHSDRSLDAATFTSPLEASEALARLENEADARERTGAQIINPTEAAWIVQNLGPSNERTPAESALLSFIGREATSLPPEIRALIDRQAA